MAATFSDLQTRVQRYLIDLPTPVQTEVPKLINEAMKEIQRRHNFKVMETLGGPYSTTVETRILASMPTNFKEYRGEPYFLEDTGRAFGITLGSSPQEPLGTFETDDEGPPVTLVEGEPNDLGVRSWSLYPLPDGLSDYDDGEYRVYVPYWRYLPELVNSSDSNWFTNNAEEWLVERAIAAGFFADWDEERGTFWLQKAAGRFNDIINTDKRYRVSGVSHFVPLWRGVYDQKVKSRNGIPSV